MKVRVKKRAAAHQTSPSAPRLLGFGQRRKSLTSKLLLGIGSILALVVVTLVAAAYHEVKRSALEGAAEQLGRAAFEVASAVGSYPERWLSSARTIAADPAIDALLETRDPAALAAFEEVLDITGAAAETVVATAIVDPRGTLIAMVPVDAQVPRLTPAELSAAQEAGLGNLTATGSDVIFPVIVPVSSSSGVRLVIWRRLDLDIRLAGAEVFVGSEDGGTWTDLRAVVSLPPQATVTGARTALYHREGAARLSASARIPGAPWLVIIETLEQEVMAPAWLFLRRITALSTVILVIGLLTVSLIGRSTVRPLHRLTEAAEAISGGDYAARVGKSGSDEIGRLSSAFDGMAERVEQAHDRLQQQSAYYRMLFDKNPNPMWVYERSSLRFLEVNEAAVRRYGYSRDELLSMSLEDIRPPDEVPRLLQHVAQQHRVLDSAGVWRHRTKSGEELTVEITSNEVELDGSPAVLVLAHDVTRERRAEELLRSAHDQLRAIVESAPVAIFSLDGDGKVRSWNRAAEQIFGWREAEAIGRPLPEGMEPLRDYAALISQERNTAGRAPVEELTCRKKDGDTVPVRAGTGALYDASGGITGTMFIASDGTELRQLEQRYRQAQKMEAVGRLAGGVAHDFNNLLTVILGESDMTLAALPESHPVRPAILEIRGAGDRASGLTRQLLAFSRQQPVALTVFALNDLVTSLDSMLRRVIGANVELVTRLDPEAGAVRADRGQIEQVLVNLVVNARDAMPDGGLLVLETASVNLDEEYVHGHVGEAKGEYVRLTVSDSGEGMTEEVLSQALEPFFTTRPIGQGTGLGLATCYGVAKQAGGSIELYSEPGVGTTVKVYLPRTSAAPEHRVTAGAPKKTGGSERILVVEDEPTVSAVTARMLASLGYEVVTAIDADDALRILEQPDEPIDLLLTDVVLPGLQGGELARRARLQRPGLRVLFTSGYTKDVPAFRKLIEESAALVEKPFTTLGLGRRVREVLDEG